MNATLSLFVCTGYTSGLADIKPASTNLELLNKCTNLVPPKHSIVKILITVANRLNYVNGCPSRWRARKVVENCGVKILLAASLSHNAAITPGSFPDIQIEKNWYFLPFIALLGVYALEVWCEAIPIPVTFK